MARLRLDVLFASEDRGAHTLRIDVLSPGGALYAQLNGSVEVGADGKGSVSQPLEIAGTPIDRFRQIGKWRFLVGVDGGAPLASAEVELTE